MVGDQAAGLRTWVEQQQPTADSAAAAAGPEQTLIIAGVPPTREALVLEQVREQLQQWQDDGAQWLGEATAWDVRVAPEHPGLWGEVAAEFPRWALWVGFGASGFRAAYETLRLIQEQPVPRQLLVVHAPVVSRRGLLNNVQQVAAQYLNIELLVLAR